MIIDVCCPGPSLAQYDKGRTPDIRICLNRAIHQIPCEYWCLQDMCVWEETKCRPKIGLITTPAFVGKVESLIGGYKVIDLGPRMKGTGCNYTAPRMLRTIVTHWPDAEVHIWGMDMVGLIYFDGTEWLPKRKTRDILPDRIKGRWAAEASLLEPYLALPNVFRHN